jgi:hypothetical protein
MPGTSDVRTACMEQVRTDTHAHLSDRYPDLREQAEGWGDFATTQGLIDSRETAEGCRRLHGIDPGPFVRPEAPEALFDKATHLRKKGSWNAIEDALDHSNISRQFCFCSTKPENGRPFSGGPGRDRLSYLAYIDTAVNGSGQFPSPDLNATSATYYENLCSEFGHLSSLGHYLDELDTAIDTWPGFGVVGMKSAMAYTSGLKVSNPSRDEARSAFERRGDMSMADFHTVRDFAFHHALRACLRNGLPVVIHTGFQIWGHAPLEQSNPSHLHNLIINPDYRDLTFVLLHGGNPYVGEMTYLAGMFENVILDFTWISWMTPVRFRFALSEWLATVPHHKFCWGSDSGTPESIAGIDWITRGLIADVLEESISDGIIDERYAMEFIENTYRKTARRVFGV